MPTFRSNPDKSLQAPRSQAKKVLVLAKQQGVLRSCDLDAAKLPRAILRRLSQQGKLSKIGRGLYVSEDASPTENRSLAEAARRVPAGVICLLSALRFHGLTTQLPFEVWIALDRKARKPVEKMMSLRIARFSGVSLTKGVEVHQIDGVTTRIYSVAKTVADCFKYRNKIGRDVAVEALRDCLRQKKAPVDSIWRYAQICRVTNVMSPYLEALA